MDTFRTGPKEAFDIRAWDWFFVLLILLATHVFKKSTEHMKIGNHHSPGVMYQGKPL